MLDVYRSRRNIRKVRFQLRYRRDIVLARLCTAVSHGNPDGSVIRFPHLHLYREGYLDKWAHEISSGLDSPASALEHFCTVISLPVPEMQGGLL